MIATLRLSACVLLCSQLLLSCASRAPIQPPHPVGVRVMAPATKTVTPGRPLAAGPNATKSCANCPTPDPDFAPQSDEVPAGIENTPDAVPVAEARSRYGNPDNYDALGEHYQVMKQQPKSFHEYGRASWYGKKFHGKRTANGEVYDMFKMSAAHKTLPLPSYARITNKGNGRSVVVRINDRGPFHPGRIIDLSYAAASRLDLLHHGSADVELEALTPQQGESADEQAGGKPRYLEVGRFADPIDAIALRDRLTQLGFTDTELLQTKSPAGDGSENILQIGPFRLFAKLEAARIKLGLQDIPAMPVAN